MKTVKIYINNSRRANIEFTNHNEQLLTNEIATRVLCIKDADIRKIRVIVEGE